MPDNPIPPRATRRSPRRILKGGGFLAVIAAVMVLLVYSPIFTLQHIALDGASYLKDDDIMAIADIHRGEPLFSLKTDEVAKRLEQDLRIEDAQVRRVLPATLAVHITERRPLATIATSYGYADVDRTGKVLAVHKSLASMQIPLITGFNLHEKYVGDDVPDESLQSILYFLGQLPEGSMGQISEIAMLRPDYVVAYTTGSVQIRLGALDRLDEKAKLTKGFLEDLKASPYTIEYVDFSYTSPFIKLKDEFKKPKETDEITE
ncbi:MAG: FtsQ-type POTRA domain-containing protein [Selenomonadaceae bacterium]|nr:FtsQ-type POTRA domain-containing protein [Selenomonadaceae bacterium]